MNNQNTKCEKCGSENVHISRDSRTHMREHICQNCGHAWYHKGDKIKSILGFILGFVIGFVIMFAVLAIV